MNQALKKRNGFLSSFFQMKRGELALGFLHYLWNVFWDFENKMIKTTVTLTNRIRRHKRNILLILILSIAFIMIAKNWFINLILLFAFSIQCICFCNRKGNFLQTCKDIRLPDDCTIGYIITIKLKIPLVETFSFHSHIEQLSRIKNLTKQVTNHAA